MSDAPSKIKWFESHHVRAEWDAEHEKWWFSVLDTIAILTDQPNYKKVRNYWKWLKHKLNAEGSQLVSATNQLKLVAADGKRYKTDVLDTEQVLRLIQSIPSPKAEPFKLWLAQVGSERLDETADPELSIDRAVQNYQRMGYSEQWINQRLKSIEVRKALTNEWDKAGVQKGREYAALTDLMSRTWSGLSIRDYKQVGQGGIFPAFLHAGLVPFVGECFAHFNGFKALVDPLLAVAHALVVLHRAVDGQLGVCRFIQPLAAHLGQPELEGFSLGGGDGLDQAQHLFGIQHIGLVALAIGSNQFQLVSGTNQLTAFCVQLVFEPLPVVADFFVVGLVGQDGDGVQHGEPPFFVLRIPFSADVVGLKQFDLAGSVAHASAPSPSISATMASSSARSWVILATVVFSSALSWAMSTTSRVSLAST